jgi:hypothetical protein
VGKNTPIKEALGLGEVIRFSDGTQLPCVPANLETLEDAMKYWAQSLGKGLTIQGCYLPGNEEAKEAFEELLDIATGRKIGKERLRKEIRVADGGKEVIAFLDRFLGFNHGSSGMGEKE